MLYLRKFIFEEERDLLNLKKREHLLNFQRENLQNFRGRRNLFNYYRNAILLLTN